MKRLCFFLTLASLSAPAALLAQPAEPLTAGPATEPPALPPAAYALIVGSNAGGPGQKPLRYAESDAQRMAEVLVTLGGYDATRVTRLLAPSAGELAAEIDRLSAALQAHARAGEPSRFFFYYSGHARADALNIGNAEVALRDLRARLLELPASLSIVVLDACQSGAFARTKGATPATDFSFNSVEKLSTQGIAVIASSSGEELSQESDELQSSHFTHHWLVALRGAGDANHDGAVTLAEAYEYAYGRTLATTSTTTIGEQHVTLEMDLTGHGEVALTRPLEARARLVVPKGVKARVLLQHLPSYSVAAELDKTSADELRLALPAGRYQATVRLPNQVLRCTYQLADGLATELSFDRCKRVELEVASAKGGGAAALEPGHAPVTHARHHLPATGDEGFFIDLLAGGGTDARGDGYEQRLDAFGFGQDSPAFDVDVEIAIGRRLHQNFALGLMYFDLDAMAYVNRERDDQSFVFDSFAGSAFVQGDVPFGRGRFFDLFARAAVGYAHVSTRLRATRPLAEDAVLSPSDLRSVDESFGGPSVAFEAGLQLNVAVFMGVQALVRYTYAPVLENELGDTHDVGGLNAMLGVRFRSWEMP
jgi:hypothetical protein